MQQSKPNNKPFWSLVILLILVLALRVSFVIVLLRMWSSAIPTIIWQSVITLVILAAEAGVYRILRARFHRMSWVWTHIILLYLILIILPLAYLFGNFVLPLYLNPDGYSDLIAKFGMAQRILFWSGIGIGHFFFVLTIVYGFRKEKVTESPRNEAPNLLDEFHQ